MKVAIFLGSLLGLVACSLARSSYYDDLVWNSYKMDFDKFYESESEERLRRQIFEDNKDVIEAHNQRWLAGDESYEMGVNQFTDMLDEEFAVDDDVEDMEMEPFDNIDKPIHVPKHVNWTQMGAVSPVGNMGHFNNSWAFAAAGVVESRQFIHTGKMVVLSKQNLVDCCRGKNHLTATALICIKKKKGIDTEASYPYRGLAGRCRFNKRTIGAHITKAFQVRPGNETVLAMNVAKGPVAAVISLNAIKHYRRGVFNNPRCPHTPNFAVLIVGYGTCKSAGDFWIVKAPLGPHWGEKGYIRIARGKQNICGITNRAYYPTF
ncbi:hypothetical protein ACLKA7_013734 [Drosophila subpalustris]